jgi:hypothetical protein
MVLHSTCIACILILLSRIAHAALPSGSIHRQRVHADVGCDQYFRIDWFRVEHFYGHYLVKSCRVFVCRSHLHVPLFLSPHCYVCLFGVICRYIGGKKVYVAVPYQVKACVFAALLYNIVETLPSLVLKHNLPCSECKTEEW